MIFNFITYRLGFLKQIPLLPQIFDGFMLLMLCLFDKNTLNAIEEIDQEVLGWSHIQSSIHKYGGTQYNYKNKEIGHIHGNGIVDVLLNTQLRHSLVSTGKAFSHHTFPNSGWISIYIKSKKDIAIALDVLKLSMELKRKNLEN